MAAFITVASSTGSIGTPIYAKPTDTTVTDELIEAAVIEKDKITQSS